MTLQEVHTPAQFTIEPGETCLTALMDTAKKRPHGVMFTRPANYEWVNVTGKEFIDEVFEVAQGLIALGVQQGDRVALISATRYEWSLLDFAIWAAGAASVPVYPLKGYSLTVPISDPAMAPQSTVLDETYKVAITRFDQRIRVGGMAEIAGHDLTYQAVNGTLDPPSLPHVLMADLGGAERAVSAGLAALILRREDRIDGAGMTDERPPTRPA